MDADYEALRKRLAELGYTSHKEYDGFAIKDLRERLKSKLSTIRKAAYQDYLKTDEWQTRRQQRLQYDNHKCKFCKKTATQVHHLTYDRIYNESLYDLISVCKDCHEYIHLLD